MSDDLKADVMAAISKINDPHMGVSIVDMGIVQNVEVKGDKAEIVIKPTNPGCMSVTHMAADAKTEAEKINGITNAKIIVEGHAMADSINEMINR